jgi:hypothetical protein
MFGGRRKPLLDCQRLTLGSDDILVLKTRERLSEMEAVRIREVVGTTGIPPQRVLIVDDDLGVSVLAR